MLKFNRLASLKFRGWLRGSQSLGFAEILALSFTEVQSLCFDVVLAVGFAEVQSIGFAEVLALGCGKVHAIGFVLKL